MDTALSQPLTTVETAEQLGLLPEEFEKIKTILGRVPNFTELSIFSVMWSEHCSYKNSISLLKTLPREGDHLLAGAGEENAGLVDIGEGLACAFKIESHNHPSAIEPYQGAATGVGGIHRDIFTMGARPIAALNSLRFGNLSSDRSKHLLKGVVKGIGNYGNCFGVPTVGGEIYFDECYEVNPLVNAMSVGIVDVDKTISATSNGVGNPVYIVGSATGKDGIHGATFASEDITEESSEKLPSVQVGDPFQEKLLLEASLDLAQTDCIVGMQDMGAAGITCSTSEMSAKEGFGMRIHLDKVPTRQTDMVPFEILLSESQERMLIVVEKGKEEEVEAIFDKWDLHCEIIGEVTEGGRLQYYMYEELVADVPADDLVLGGGAPIYERETREPAYMEKIAAFDQSTVAVNFDLLDTARKLIQLPNIASKRWIRWQYDSMVGANTLTTNGPADAAVVRIKQENEIGEDKGKGIAMTVDCNSRYVHADPFIGASIAVSEAARNIVCTGGVPSAITNCLNFGNPYNPEVYWQFTNAIKGMGAACRKFRTPVTGGNVSFYNQSGDDQAVFPTPAIGMIGIVEDVKNQMTLNFKNEGDLIYVVGKLSDDMNCSEYLYNLVGEKFSPTPAFDLDEEFEMQAAVQKLIYGQAIKSAHDCSEGGLFISLMESAMSSNLNFNVMSQEGFRKDGFWFGEAQGRVVITVSSAQLPHFMEIMNQTNVPYFKLGRVGGESINIDGTDFGKLHGWRKSYDTAIERELGVG